MISRKSSLILVSTKKSLGECLEIQIWEMLYSRDLESVNSGWAPKPLLNLVTTSTSGYSPQFLFQALFLTEVVPCVRPQFQNCRSPCMQALMVLTQILILPYQVKALSQKQRQRRQYLAVKEHVWEVNRYMANSKTRRHVVTINRVPWWEEKTPDPAPSPVKCSHLTLVSKNRSDFKGERVLQAEREE